MEVGLVEGIIRNCSFARCNVLQSGRCVKMFQWNPLTPSRYKLLSYYNASFCLPSLARRLYFILRTVVVLLYFTIHANYLTSFYFFMVSFHLLTKVWRQQCWRRIVTLYGTGILLIFILKKDKRYQLSYVENILRRLLWAVWRKMRILHYILVLLRVCYKFTQRD
jgi:hypothetical protein